jgi:hypothetical protein
MEGRDSCLFCGSSDLETAETTLGDRRLTPAIEVDCQECGSEYLISGRGRLLQVLEAGLDHPLAA